MSLRSYIVGGALVLLSFFSGWQAHRRWTESGSREQALHSAHAQNYQCPMHAWVRLDQPGKCTLCGMALSPLRPGAEFAPAADNLVALRPGAIDVIHVQTEAVARRPLERVVRVAGMIEEDDTRHRILSAYVSGRIEKLFVNYVGAEVQERQPMAWFYSPTLYSAEQDYLALQQGSSNLDTTELQQEQLRLVSTVVQRLRQFGLSADQITALRQKPDLQMHSEILAPMTGTVVARSVYEGQYVKEGDKLFEMADLSTLWFRFDVYERDLDWVRPGQIVEVTTPSAPGKVFQAKVAFVEPALAEHTRSAKARAELPNPLIEQNGQKRRELYCRLYAEGVVRVEKPNTLVVPRSAVLSHGSQWLAYVEQSSGVYERRLLKLGQQGEEDWEVLEGLSEGELIVAQGNLLIDAQAQLQRGTGAPRLGDLP